MHPRFETLALCGCRMWIDGPILLRRGYVNMIKADYSVHLQIKGAEPISTPTFNTADDQVRIQPGKPRWAHFIWHTKTIQRKKFQGTLSKSHNLSLSECFPFIWFVLSTNEKGRRDNKQSWKIGCHNHLVCSDWVLQQRCPLNWHEKVLWSRPSMLSGLN